MKQFIKNKLRSLVEGRMSSHTPSNPSGAVDKRDTKPADLNRALHRIALANETYSKFTDEQKEELGDVYTGDGLYEVQLSTNGDLRGKANWMGKKAAPSPGGYNDPNPNKRYFYVMANRGVSHPEYDDDTRQGYIVGASPMADAVLKVRLFMSEHIISFLENNLGYLDDKGEEIRKEKMTPAEIERLKGKEDLYKKRSSQKITMGGYEDDIRRKLELLQQERLELMRTGDRKSSQDLRREESLLKKELSFVQRLKNLLRDNPQKLDQEIALANREDIYDKMPELAEGLILHQIEKILS